jgi:starch phosphorylase
MNGAINVSLPDGWIPEFAIDKENSFLVKPAAEQLSINEIDIAENRNLMDVLENTVLPAYYNNQAQWLQVLKKAAADIIPGFDANRLAAEYYEKMYSI